MNKDEYKALSGSPYTVIEPPYPRASQSGGSGVVCAALDDDDDVRCHDSGSSASKSTENSGADGGKLCHIYAQIRESSTPSNVVVCSDDQQQNEKLVYTSESNVVRVQLTAADDNDVYFLIKFEGLYPVQSINQSINARFVGRRYTTRPGAPAIVSCKHDQKVHF